MELTKGDKVIYTYVVQRQFRTLRATVADFIGVLSVVIRTDNTGEQMVVARKDLAKVYEAIKS